MQKYLIEEWKGKKFGHLTVVDRNGKNFVCVCDCGREKIVRPYFIVKGTVKTCGDRECPYHQKLLHDSALIHGGTGTKLYKRYQGMKERCYNPHHKHYYLYGGRGIKICDEWLKGFDAFAEWAYANGFREDLSIDRIDVNGDYCPENCRWADNATQTKNRRPVDPRKAKNARVYEIDGVKDTITGWGRKYNIYPQILSKRISKGMTMKEAVTYKPKKRRINKKVDVEITRGRIKRGDPVSVERILKLIIEDNKITQADIADKLGVSRQRVSSALSQNDMKIGTVAEMLKACGYRLVVVREDEEHNGLEIG